MRGGFHRLASAVIAVLALAACGATTNAGPSATPDPLSGSITVFAASSLTSVFNTAEKGLELDHPGFTAKYSFAGSQSLVTQIIYGAPADVIATANMATMTQLVAKGLVNTPEKLCQNKLEIIVAPGNPKKIMTLGDLVNPAVSVVIGDPSVPVGQYAQEVLTTAGLKLTPKSLQLDDAEVVRQVESGNADAALVFVTDVISAGNQVTGVPIPDAQNKVGTYEIAVVTASTNDAAAQAFVTSAVSGDIQAELRTDGFLPPPAA